MMSILRKLWSGLRHAGVLIYQSNDMSPHTGVWITRISPGAVIAQFMFMASILIFNLLFWWYGGRTDKQWWGLVMTCSAMPIAFVSTLVAHTLDKHPDRPPSSRVFLQWAGLTALIGLPFGNLVLLVGQHIEPLSQPSPFLRYLPEIMVAFVIGFSYYRLVIIRLWYERLATEELKRHTAEQGQALAETRLHMLQAQIEPHFLFNTLTSIQHLVRTDPEQADFLLTQLISYLRQAIPDVRGTASTLGRELASIQTYLDIVRVRMGGRLTVAVQCDPALAAVPFPSLIIHTLVENAIKHGVEMKTGPVAIGVTATPVRNGIEVCVQDNGVGFGAIDSVSGGVGLQNIRDRLALAYDGGARLDIADLPEGGVRATVSIPGNSAGNPA